MTKNLDKETEKKCREILPKDVVNFIDDCMKKEKPESFLIAVLHELQDKLGYLPNKEMSAVAHLMQVPEAKVSGIASFYHYFRLKARGKILINVCLGTACFVKGADLIVKKIEEELGIKFGETTTNGLFTLESTRCLGMCALAPVLKIGETIYSQVTADQIPSIISSYIEKHKRSKKNET